MIILPNKENESGSIVALNVHEKKVIMNTLSIFKVPSEASILIRMTQPRPQ